jgi:hypothetical protein
MTIYFRTSPAWTFMAPGSPEHEAALVASALEKDSPKPLKRRDSEQLRGRLTELARYQERVSAPDFAVLTSITPTIRVLASVSVHFVDDENSLERIVEDAWDERRVGRLLADPAISTTQTLLGVGTRIHLRHKPEAGGLFRRAPTMVSVRWVLPYQEGVRDRVCLVTGMIPDETDAEIAVPEIDRFALDISQRPHGSADESHARGDK